MSIDCYFCGREFLDFAPLAHHVQVTHFKRLWHNCDGSERRAKGEKNMAQEQWPDAGGNKDFNPWLTVEHLGKAGKGILSIVGNPRKSTSQFGEGVIVDVKLNGSEYSWTVKFSSGNYTRLTERFGKPDKWHGKKVNVEVKEYLQKEYVAVI